MLATPANKAFTVGYSYSSGRQSGITYPSGRAVAYSFDAKGQVAGITVDGATILSSATYFPFGAVKGWTWGNGQAFARTFDTDGRIAAVTVGPNAGSYADLSQVFTYDNLDRLKSAGGVAGQSQVYTYDANSNRTSLSVNSAVTTYNYPGTSHKLSSLSGATTRSFTYDNAGNATASAGITYVYDDRGRMKSAGAATYLVNGLGQRVKKNAGGDVFFAYDEAGHFIGEYDSTGAPIQETVWLGDTPVAVVKPKTGGFDVFYIWTDNLGTPRLITDTANVSRWEWPIADPFGNTAPSENPAGAGVFAYNLRFPGQYFDAETGKHYNYFRDYDPAIGRYVEGDPIGLRAGLNRYAFVTSNSLRFIDRLGLCKLQLTDDQCCNHDVTQKTLTSQAAGGTVMCCGGRKVPCAETPNGPNPGQGLIKNCILAHETRHIPDVECSPYSDNTIEQAHFRRDVPKEEGECNAYTAHLDCLSTAIAGCGTNGQCQDWVRQDAAKMLTTAEGRYRCGFGL